MINGTETQWRISFWPRDELETQSSSNERASSFIRQCADNGIPIAGIEHATQMTVFFWTEQDADTATMLLL